MAQKGNGGVKATGTEKREREAESNEGVYSLVYSGRVLTFTSVGRHCWPCAPEPVLWGEKRVKVLHRLEDGKTCIIPRMADWTYRVNQARLDSL